MSLRYASRLVVQGSAKAVQGVKDHAAKSIKDTSSAATSYSSSSSSSSSSRLQARRLTSALDSIKSVSAEEKRKRAEESLRTVMYLSCWGPN